MYVARRHWQMLRRVSASSLRGPRVTTEKGMPYLACVDFPKLLPRFSRSVRMVQAPTGKNACHLLYGFHEVSGSVYYAKMSISGVYDVFVMS